MSAASAAEPLPCLFKNNSDKATLSARRKAAFSIASNASEFVREVGLDCVGVLTVTMPRQVRCPREYQRRWNNFARRIVAKLFGGRMRAVEPHADGRPHSHALVDCEGDIRTGFNWAHYDATRAWGRKRPRHLRDKPQGSLNRSPLLTYLHGELAKHAKRYGLGRVELVPLRSTGEAVGRYIGGYLAKGSSSRSEDWKGVRHVSYTRNSPRSHKGPWAWGAHGRRWRRQLHRWAAKHGCASLADVAAVFGPRWCFHHADAIAATDEAAPVAVIPESVAAPPGVGRSYVLRRRDSESHWQRPLRLSG